MTGIEKHKLKENERKGKQERSGRRDLNTRPPKRRKSIVGNCRVIKINTIWTKIKAVQKKK